MKKTNLSVAAPLLALFLFSAALNAQGQGGRGGGLPNNPPPTSPVTGDPVAGKQLYYEYSCYACHGYGGRDRSASFCGDLGASGHGASLYPIPSRARRRRARKEGNYHAQFRRKHFARQAGQGHLRLHPDLQEHCAAAEGYSDAERHHRGGLETGEELIRPGGMRPESRAPHGLLSLVFSATPARTRPPSSLDNLVEPDGLKLAPSFLAFAYSAVSTRRRLITIHSGIKHAHAMGLTRISRNARVMCSL